MLKQFFSRKKGNIIQFILSVSIGLISAILVRHAILEIDNAKDFYKFTIPSLVLLNCRFLFSPRRRRDYLYFDVLCFLFCIIILAVLFDKGQDKRYLSEYIMNGSKWCLLQIIFIVNYYFLISFSFLLACHITYIVIGRFAKTHIKNADRYNSQDINNKIISNLKSIVLTHLVFFCGLNLIFRKVWMFGFEIQCDLSLFKNAFVYGFLYNGIPAGFYIYLLNSEKTKRLFKIKISQLENNFIELNLTKSIPLLFGVYFTLFGIIWARYEYRNNYIQNRLNTIMAMQKDENFELDAIKNIPELQNIKSFDEPSLIWFIYWNRTKDNPYMNILRNSIITAAKKSKYNSNEKKFTGFLSGVDLTGVDLREYGNIRGVDLSSATLKKAQLEKFTFENSNLEAVRLNRAFFEQTHFYNSILDDAELKDAQGKNSSFDATSLLNAHFDRSNLKNAFFEYSNLTNASFVNSDLHGTHFFYSNILAADFTKAKNVQDANFVETEWYLAKLTPSQKKALRKKYPCKAKENSNNNGIGEFNHKCPKEEWYEKEGFSGIDLSKLDLSHVNFNQYDEDGGFIRSTDLSGSNIMLTDFRNTYIGDWRIFKNTNWWKARFSRDQKTELQRKFKCKKGCPAKEWFSTDDLAGANFEGDDLRGAKLMSADFYKVNLRKANLSFTDISFADLTRSLNWNQAYFEGSNWQFAKLTKVQKKWFREKYPCQVTCPPNEWYENEGLVFQAFYNIDLSKADFRNTDLTNTKFANSNLEKSDFTNSKLINTDFSSSYLKGAYLSQTDINNAFFNNANWWEANITKEQKAILEKKFPCENNLQGFKEGWTNKIFFVQEYKCELFVEK